MASTTESAFQVPFRPRARLLQLLGDELIGSSRLAIFELVKNAYDADATQAEVLLDLRPNHTPSITVSDDGAGMTPEIIREVWLVPGDDYRQKQRARNERSPRFHRLPLGEKGLGRFAVHKLGNRITVITRAARSKECVVEITWSDLIKHPFLADAPVTVQVRRPELFTGQQTGTWIKIEELRQDRWSRGEVRRLQRQITSICSPFGEPTEFRATLTVAGREHWLEGIPDVREILNRAIWQFSFSLEDGRFDWKYKFKRIPGLKLEPRNLGGKKDHLLLPPKIGIDEDRQKKLIADSSTTEGIGAVHGQFFIYDRDREVLKRLPETQLLTEYLDENGGVRVYRDGIRVYNYGEPGDDWLGLDLRRVNIPTRRISRNIILGAVQISLQGSDRLIEKTNREGFVENDACSRLKRIVLAALAKLESERQIDKDNIRKLTAQASDPEVAKIQKPIQALRRELQKKGLLKKFEPYISKIEHDYLDMQETLLQAGMSGLNLAVVFHEVERGVRALHTSLSEGSDPAQAATQAQDLMRILDGFTALLRKDSRTDHSARQLIDAARRFNVLRFRHHKVRFVCPPLQKEEPGFSARFTFSLALGALNNLIDNSLYWMRVRWPDVPEGEKASPRQLYVGISDEFEGPAIVVADTGPGFQDDADKIIRPFFTRKPNGMGLGLYYANLAMELNGGQLIFPTGQQADIPKNFDGAVAALVFARSK